jgi:hypothetical protein
MTPQLRQKLAAIDADLISVAHEGPAAIHAVVFQKLAELGLDEPEDIEAVLVGLGELEKSKTAEFAAMPGGKKPGYENAMRAVALGSMVAAPATAAVKFLMAKRAKENALSNLQSSAPDLFQQNPQRAEAMFDLLHDSAPNVAQNTPVAADLMRQMMAAPQLDIGTVGRLSDVGKNYATIEGKDKGHGGVLDGIKNAPGYMSGAKAIITGQPGGSSGDSKHAGVTVPCNHVTADKVPCFFDWSSDACKEAGLTDAFTGSGDTMDQADQAFNFSQMEQGNTLLPLDTVVRELMQRADAEGTRAGAARADPRAAGAAAGRGAGDAAADGADLPAADRRAAGTARWRRDRAGARRGRRARDGRRE